MKKKCHWSRSHSMLVSAQITAETRIIRSIMVFQIIVRSFSLWGNYQTHRTRGSWAGCWNEILPRLSGWIRAEFSIVCLGLVCIAPLSAGTIYICSCRIQRISYTDPKTWKHGRPIWYCHFVHSTINPVYISSLTFQCLQNL